LVKLKVKINKMGNSVRMTIPRPILDALGWEPGDEIEVDAVDGKLVAEKPV